MTNTLQYFVLVCKQVRHAESWYYHNGKMRLVEEKTTSTTQQAPVILGAVFREGSEGQEIFYFIVVGVVVR